MGNDKVNRLTGADPVANRAFDNVRAVVNPLLTRTSSVETHIEQGTQSGITWDDIQGPAISAGGASAVVIEAYGDTLWQGVFYRHDRDDVQFFGFQFPHRWNRGEVRGHAHIVPMADPAAAQVIKLSGRFAWAQYGKPTAVWANWTTFDVAHTVNPGDIRKPSIASLFSSTPTEAKESDFLLVYFARLGSSDAADTYTTSKPGSGTAAANMCLLGLDIHFQVNKTGTISEIPV